MTEPFARASHDLSNGMGGYESVVYVRNKVICRYSVAEQADDKAEALNELARKYAADKIREAADTIHEAEGYGAFDGDAIGFLRSRADAVERGEA